MDILLKHVTGVPNQLTPHKLRKIDEVVDAHITKASSVNKDRDALCFGERLHMDFNFMRASSNKYEKQKAASRIVESQQGHRAALTIIDKYSRKLFAFLTTGKKPPIKIIEAFLNWYKLSDDKTRYIRTDKVGGNLHDQASSGKSS